jgi:hypothetical protein
MTYEPTFTVFKSPVILFKVQEDKDYRLVRCGTAIAAGSILLVEHTFRDNFDSRNLKAVLRYSEGLFNALYPRISPWSEAVMLAEPFDNEMAELVQAKIMYNGFGNEGSNVMVVGKDISSFNHSPTPNAKVFRQNMTLPAVENGGEPVKVAFSSVVAIKDIMAGSEIFIKYNDVVKFGSGVKSTSVDNFAGDDLAVKNILGIIRKYMDGDTFAQVMSVQYAASVGLYLPNGIVIKNQRFLDFIKRVYDKHVDGAFITKWLTSIYTAFTKYGIA